MCYLVSAEDFKDSSTIETLVLPGNRYSEERKATMSDLNTEIEMVEAKEAWSEYRLADGTKLRVRPVMIAVFRAGNELTADGEPVYNMKSTLVVDVRAAAVQ